eukprot:TRINITY_DN5623_c0_g1_i2.p2 TRINITY_DN5623_c0_g1~~TRINITY_DN5623_c0_g1_i2.p2  ORF type:complete len:599 (+),score=237.66 TRINITY_DN5623_c0_g1_i2:37-1833(+)
MGYGTNPNGLRSPGMDCEGQSLATIRRESDGASYGVSEQESLPARAKSTEAARLMETEPTELEPMSATEKGAFALGALVNAISNCCVGFYLNPFMLEVAALTPTIISLMMFVGRGWDAITTAVVGVAVAKFPNIRMWLYMTAVPTATAYFFLWIVWDIGQTGKAAYAFGLYLVMQLGTSAYHVPYTALTVRMHPSPKQRDVATTWRMLAEVLSVLIGAGVQGVIISMYQSDDECTSCDADGDTEQAKGYVISAGVMAGIMTVCGLICPFFIKERVKSNMSGGEQDTAGALKVAFKSRSFLTLTFAFFFIWLVVQGVQGNILLYAKYAVPTWKDKFQILLFLFVFCATLGMPMWMFIMRKIGKKRAYMLGSFLLASLLHVMYWLPDNTSWQVGMVLCVFLGLALSATYLLPWSMLPAVVDEAELVSGRRDEAIFYAFFVFFMKMGAGMALAGSALALQFAGWLDPCCIRADELIPCDCNIVETCLCRGQPDGVGNALRIVCGIAGPGLILIGILLAAMFPITPEREEEIAQAMVSVQMSRPAGENPRHSVADIHHLNFIGIPEGVSSDRPAGWRNTLPASGSPGNPLMHLRKPQRHSLA